MQHEAPTTRRGLRRAEQAALAGAAARAGRATRTGARAVLPPRHLLLRPGCVVVLSAAFVAGAITQVYAEQTARDDYRAAVAAVAAAERAEQVQLVRLETAAADRLTGQAVAYAASRRTEALELAPVADGAADAAVLDAAPVVTPEAMSPLDAASAQLAALVAAAPAAPQLLAPLPARAGAGAAPTDGPETAVPGAAGTSAPDPSASPVAAVAASYVVPSNPLSAVAPSATPVTPLLPPAPPVAAPPASAAVQALDVSVSNQLIAAAQQVVDLSAQVQATAEATIAQAEAEARAAAEAALAAQAAAETEARAAETARAERARKVSVAVSADNGRIPPGALCGVGFDADVQLRCDAAAALEDLNAAFEEYFGYDLAVSSSYRDYAAQLATKLARGSLAAPVGTSNHGVGLAADFEGFGAVGDFSRSTYRWMQANAQDYGWHHPSYMEPGGAGPAEPWHWEFDTEH